MVRYARIATVLMLIWLGAAVSEAQTANDRGMFADANIAATLGHKSDKAFGGEWGMQVRPDIDVFVEGGHMGNVGTSDLDRRAQVIAEHIGATVSSTAHKVNFFDGGVRYRFSPVDMWRPYVLFGLGVAHVKNEVAFGNVQGNLEDLVQLGTDLAGSVNKVLLVVGGGTHYIFRTRYFADVSYRYGHIFAKSGVVEDDVSIKTQRVQFGVGVRF